MSERADHPPVDHPGEPSLMSQVCDIVRYAPIAILLDGPGMLPKLAQQGKVHVGNARYLGRRAIREAEPALRRLAQGLGEQAGGLLQVVGVVPPASPPGGAAPAPSSPAPSGAAPAPEPVSGNGSSPPAPTGPAADDLAIPDYESLSASHVVNRLPGLTADELEAVRLYETAHRGRKTILNKVAQLQAAG